MTHHVQSPDVFLRRADERDRPLLERLWLMFRYDMSEYFSTLPAADGTFRAERLEMALTHPDRAAYVIELDGSPAGLVIVRGIRGAERIMNSFFVVRGARRSGVGRHAVHNVVGRYPGDWSVPFQDSNAGAAAFWRRVATSIAGSAWTDESRAVPGRNDLPPDRWISFRAT